MIKTKQSSTNPPIISFQSNDGPCALETTKRKKIQLKNTILCALRNCALWKNK